MRVISAEDLKAKLDRGDDFKLVMTMGDFAYQQAHIPGSLSINRLDEAEEMLDKDEEIIVYCSNVTCPASIAAYHYLVKAGFKDVTRFSGGLDGWQAAGYTLESSLDEAE